jgi:hypothetical protein
VGNVTCLGEDTHAPTTGTVTAEVACEPGDACGGARARSTGPVEQPCADRGARGCAGSARASSGRRA